MAMRTSGTTTSGSSDSAAKTGMLAMAGMDMSGAEPGMEVAMDMSDMDGQEIRSPSGE